MECHVRWSDGRDTVLFEIKDISGHHTDSLENFIPDLTSFTMQYLKGLSLLKSAHDENDVRKATVLYAQLLKSRALLDDAKRQLQRGLEAAVDGGNLSELGFPDLEAEFRAQT